MAHIIDGKAISAAVRADIAAETAKMKAEIRRKRANRHK